MPALPAGAGIATARFPACSRRHGRGSSDRSSDTSVPIPASPHPWVREKPAPHRCRSVRICEDLFKKLEEWREHLKTKRKDVSPTAFIFRGRFGGPLDPSNYRKRVLHKLARKLELPKLTFQVIRRMIATLAQKLGSSKDVQGFMRHETTDTTENVYMQVLLPEVRTTLDAIHAELSKKAGASPAPEPPMTPRAGTATNSSSRNDVLGMPTAIPENTTTQVAAVPAKPARGVVLEFATKPRKGDGAKCLM